MVVLFVTGEVCVKMCDCVIDVFFNRQLVPVPLTVAFGASTNDLGHSS